LCAIHIGCYLQADLTAFADGGVNGFLDNAVRSAAIVLPPFLLGPVDISQLKQPLSSGDTILAFMRRSVESPPQAVNSALTPTPPSPDVVRQHTAT